LLEVHDANELARALRAEVTVIGVNNRDLHTFEVSVETAAGLAARVPAGRLLVAESGLRDHADVERLAACGVDAVLVGESLLRREDVGAGVTALMRPVPLVAGRPVAGARREEDR
jgi:indole-3-glycerol phosphate synthase